MSIKREPIRHFVSMQNYQTPCNFSCYKQNSIETICMVGKRLFKLPEEPCKPAAHLFPWQKDEAVAKVLITCMKVLQQQSFQCVT
jgi:hypothetical protein